MDSVDSEILAEDTETEPENAVRPISVSPEFNADGVPVDQVIRIRFGGHLDPASVRNTLFSLYSGQNARWLMLYYDPVTREIAVWPGSPMRAGALWELALLEGLRGIDGSDVLPGVVARFITSDVESGQRPFPHTTGSDVLPIFERHCAGCHNQPNPFSGLDLSSAAGIEKTAIGIVSDAWPAWSRIARYRPADSYLIYKIIDDYEYRAGRRMPRSLEDEGGTKPLTIEEQQTISNWIVAGAVF